MVLQIIEFLKKVLLIISTFLHLLEMREVQLGVHSIFTIIITKILEL